MIVTGKCDRLEAPYGIACIATWTTAFSVGSVRVQSAPSVHAAQKSPTHVWKIERRAANTIAPGCSNGREQIPVCRTAHGGAVAQQPSCWNIRSREGHHRTRRT